MYGLEAIKVGNGWEIAIVGISIVFTGLSLLSVFIGQIHKLLGLWENRREIKFFKRKEVQADRKIIKFTESQKIEARQFLLLMERMDSHFSLPRLLVQAEISGIGKPYSHLYILLKSGIIRPDNEGFHFLDMETFNRLIL